MIRETAPVRYETKQDLFRYETKQDLYPLRAAGANKRRGIERHPDECPRNGQRTRVMRRQ
ncbi:hypothetical protein CKO41_17775 [Thiococcus pfennigii]|nr:hypothetical protein [Thiococcus pfennigii]